jgi:hypothetical protein
MENIKLYLLFALGVLFAQAIRKIGEMNKKSSLRRDRLKQFKEILSNIREGKSVFVSRLNQTVMLDTKIKDYGVVNIVYLMDKKVVCIFKDSKCLHTTEEIKEIGGEIEVAIHNQYGSQIDDVVQVLGVTISREELESQMKKFEEELGKNMKNISDLKMNLKSTEESSDVQKIIEENESRMDVDAILDKISRVGIKRLSKEELEFLKKQSEK